MISFRLRFWKAWGLGALFALSQTPAPAGGIPEEIIFVHGADPDRPIERYLDGDLQIFLPSYSTAYLYVAYRYLAGRPPTEPLKAAIAEVAAAKASWEWQGNKAVSGWLDQRNRTLEGGERSPPSISVHRSIGYQYFLNCHDVAFHLAAQTHADRIRRFGADSAAVVAWLEGQDQVFQNCGGGESIPQPLGADFPEIIRKDRTYQIAAAAFYSAQFDLARETFLKIAGDRSSPWRKYGEYLAARSLIRKAMLQSVTPEEYLSLLEQAGRELEAIVSTEALFELHDSARGLLSFIKLRLHPEEMLTQIGRNLLLDRTTGKDLKQDFIDYLWLIQKRTEAEDPFIEWLRNFQAGRFPDQAFSRWRADGSLQWLVAALRALPPEHDGVSELLLAADEVKSDSPAFPFVMFHRARLLRVLGDADRARTILDSLLNAPPRPISPSSRNLLKAMRMSMAVSLEEWIELAVRKPVRLAYIRGYLHDWPEEDSDGWRRMADLFFDADAAAQLTARMPLAVLTRLLELDSLDLHLDAQLVQFIWTRAVLLDRLDVAEKLSPRLRRHFPFLDPHLASFEDEQRPEHKRFAAAFLLVKFPGFHPYVPRGPLRATAFRRIDNMRSNWWCRMDRYNYRLEIRGSAGPLSMAFSGTRFPFPQFLSEEELEAAKREWETLLGLETAPNLLGGFIVDYARKFRSDPRVPEALHRAVRTTRYGCTDGGTGDRSRAAFQLLHRHFPNSPWTERTPYWFR